MIKIKAIKKATTDMIEVTGIEFKEIQEKYPEISVSEFDQENIDWSSKNVIGYIAGDIEGILQKKRPEEVADLWLVNKTYFDENYQEV